jgi:cytoskeletal protein RodZ
METGTVETGQGTGKEGSATVSVLDLVNALNSHHTTISYGLIAVLFVVLGLCGFGGWLGLKYVDAQVARADAADARYQDAQKHLTELLAEDARERSQLQSQETALEAQIAKRNAAPPAPAVQAALQPGATAQTLAKGLESSYSAVKDFGVVQPSGEAGVLLNGLQTQSVIVLNEQAKKDSGDVKDLNTALGLEKQSNVSLNKDLTFCISTLSDANKTIADYRRVIKPTKWKRFLQGAEKVGIGIGGLALGLAIHR